MRLADNKTAAEPRAAGEAVKPEVQPPDGNPAEKKLCADRSPITDPLWKRQSQRKVARGVFLQPV